MTIPSLDCAIKVTSNLDYRLFGARCLDTQHVAELPALARLMLEALNSATTYHQFAIRVYPDRHVGLTISGFENNAPRHTHVRAANLFISVVEQFNWTHERHELDYRFKLCQVSTVIRAESHRVHNTGEVTEVPVHRCRWSAGIPLAFLL